MRLSLYYCISAIPDSPTKTLSFNSFELIFQPLGTWVYRLNVKSVEACGEVNSEPKPHWDM